MNLRSIAAQEGMEARQLRFIELPREREAQIRLAFNLCLYCHLGEHEDNEFGVLDAIYANVPVLTIAGKAIHSSVGESVLRALNLDHYLVAHNHQDFQAKAIHFLQRPHL